MPWWKRAFGSSRRAPDDVDAALRAALLAVLERELDEAERLLALACRLDSTAVEPYLALARLYRMRGEIGRAIRLHQNLLLRKDLSHDQTVAALADLAEDFQKGGFLQRAIASYDEVLALAPKHRGAQRALVPLLASVRDYPRAMEIVRRLARRGADSGLPSEASLLVESAEAAHAQGRTQDARRALKKALRWDGASVKGWIALGEIEAEQGRTKAALAAWAKVPELDRRMGPLVYPRLEASYAALEKARDFEAYLGKLLAERPDDRHARLALARALAARGEIEDARTELNKLLERDSDDLEARSALGHLLLAEGREAEATKSYGELLEVIERSGRLRRRESLE